MRRQFKFIASDIDSQLEQQVGHLDQDQRHNEYKHTQNDQIACPCGLAVLHEQSINQRTESSSKFAFNEEIERFINIANIPDKAYCFLSQDAFHGLDD